MLVTRNILLILKILTRKKMFKQVQCFFYKNDSNTPGQKEIGINNILARQEKKSMIVLFESGI